MKESILRKYFKGEANPEEVRQVLNWINSIHAPEDISVYFDAFEWTKEDREINSEEMLQKLRNFINIDKSRDKLVANEASRPGTLPLQDRSPVKIGQKKNWLKPAIYIFILALIVTGISILPKFLDSTPVNEVAENTLVKKSTEKGQKLNIHLSDGTHVILNSGSSIEYEENFNDSIRQIQLTGEAFFTVARDTKRPFVVNTGDMQTTALGTSFNLHYRPESQINQVALVSGKVSVGFSNNKSLSKVVLESGEMAGIDYQSKKLFRGNFNIEQVTAWKDGIIIFKDAGLDEIIERLEYWYGVRITTIGHPGEGWVFSAKFENESLRNVLDALQYAQDIAYTIKDKHITIQFLQKAG